MSENVLERLASGKRLPILFVGSGISKRYLYRYPNWEELLELAFKNIIPIYINCRNTETPFLVLGYLRLKLIPK